MFYQVLATFLASFLIWFMFLGISFFLLRIKNKKAAFFVVFSVILAWIISEVIKDLFFTVRPFMINGFLPLTVTDPSDNSFPSGHAASAFALATSVFTYKKRAGYVTFFLACLVGLGRVISNVHYPIDVLGGAVLGVYIPLFLESFFVRVDKIT